MTTLVIRSYRASAGASRHGYQYQDSHQTLAEGLDEYYRVNQGIISRPDTLPPSSAALFRSHDICHVIFGLDTILADEAMADFRTLISTDVGIKAYSQYVRDPLAVAVFAELGWWRAIIVPLRTIPRALRALIARTNQKEKWPWRPPDAYLNRTLADLRAEYGIAVI